MLGYRTVSSWLLQRQLLWKRMTPAVRDELLSLFLAVYSLRGLESIVLL